MTLWSLRFPAVICALSMLQAQAFGARLPLEIDPNFLALSDCPDNPGCPAIVLLDERKLVHKPGRTRFIVRTVRKVFTLEGVMNYSEAAIPPTRRVGWHLRGLEGRTVLPDGTRVKLDSENIREKPLLIGGRTIMTRSAGFPGVVPGAIVDYTYEMITPNGYVWPLEIWELQQRIPVLRGIFRISSTGFGVQWARTGIDKPEFRSGYSPLGLEYEALDVPPIPLEPFGPSEEAMRSRFYFYFTNLGDKWLGSFAGSVAGRAGKFLEGGGAVKSRVNAILGDSKAPLDRIRKLYDYVQQTVKSEEHRLVIDPASNVKEAENASEVIERGFGKDYDRTMLFLSLVKEAGFPHALLLIMSRDRGVLNADAPDENQFDTLAAAVRVAGAWHFFDPATRHCRFGWVSPEKEGEQFNAILVVPDSNAGKEERIRGGLFEFDTHTAAPFEKVRIPSQPAKRNALLREGTLYLKNDAIAEAEIRETARGHVDLEFRQTYGRTVPARRVELLRERIGELIPQAHLIDAGFEDLDSFEDSAVVRYRIEVPDASSQAGDRIVVTPSLFGAWRENPFTEERRRSPVYFPYRQTITDRITVVPPEGFESGELPPAMEFQEGSISFLISFTRVEANVELLRRVIIDSPIWPVADYPRLRAFSEKLQHADKQAIIFIQKSP